MDDTPVISMLAGSSVICLPGFVLERDYDWGNAGIIGFYGVNSCSWTGGIVAAPAGLYPAGVVIKITSGKVAGNTVRSSGILIRDVVIERWTGDSAIGINGDQVTLINPIIGDPNTGNSNGIRVSGGTGFRCYGGSVEAGGDGALQFSAGPSYVAIRDGAYIGTHAVAHDGRVLLVGTRYADIDDVRFIGISGESLGGGMIQVQCFDADTAGRPNPHVRNVLCRDVAIRRTGGTDEGAVVYDFGSAADGGIAGVEFDNVLLKNTGRTTLRIGSDSLVPVTDFHWHRGRLEHNGVADPAGAAISLGRLARATFRSVWIDTDSDASAITLGVTGPCDNVVFSDATLTGLMAGQTGVRFGQATACGWRRGAIQGDAAIPAQLSGQSSSCFVTGANLAGIGGLVMIDTGAMAPRLRDNHGSAQATFVSLGAATDASGTGASLKVASSFARVPAAASPLTTIAGGAPGDLLVLSAATTAVAVTDGTGNLRLRADDALDSDDALLLLRRPGTIWVELARGDAV